jgi:ELWxxDGT repeat protein
LVKDIEPGGGSDPESLSAAAGILAFRAQDPNFGNELFRSNGTKAGTKLVADINISGDSYPDDIASVGRSVFFMADDGVHGSALWKYRT